MAATYQWSDADKTTILHINEDGIHTWFPPSKDNRFYSEFLERNENGENLVILDYVEPTCVDDIGDLTEAKTLCIDNVRRNAYAVLQPTDWVVVRAAETGVEAPADITSFRESVRAASASKITTIESKTDLESLKVYLRSAEYKNWPEQ